MYAVTMMLVRLSASATRMAANTVSAIRRDDRPRIAPYTAASTAAPSATNTTSSREVSRPSLRKLFADRLLAWRMVTGGEEVADLFVDGDFAQYGPRSNRSDETTTRWKRLAEEV